MLGPSVGRTRKVAQQSPKAGVAGCRLAVPGDTRSTLWGAFGPKPRCLRAAGWWAVGRGGFAVRWGPRVRQDPWAQLSAPGASLGPVLAGTSWPAQGCQHVRPCCPLHFQSWGEAPSGPSKASCTSAASHVLRAWLGGLLLEDRGEGACRQRSGAQLCLPDLMTTHRLAPPLASQGSLAFHHWREAQR